MLAGANANIDIFAAAAALAEDKALAADALAVEFVPQALFLQEGMELLQQAKAEMQQLTCAVTEAQVGYHRKCYSSCTYVALDPHQVSKQEGGSWDRSLLVLASNRA